MSGFKRRDFQQGHVGLIKSFWNFSDKFAQARPLGNVIYAVIRPAAESFDESREFRAIHNGK
jgi:hypothetical protein